MDVRARLRDLAVSDTGFLFDPYTGLTFSLNTTGRFVLEALKRGESPDAIAEGIAEHFELSSADDARRDVSEFVLLLRDSGLLPKDETP